MQRHKQRKKVGCGDKFFPITSIKDNGPSLRTHKYINKRFINYFVIIKIIIVLLILNLKKYIETIELMIIVNDNA